MADPQISIIIEAYTQGLQDGMRRAEAATRGASKSMTQNLAAINLAAQTITRSFQDVSNIVQEIYEHGKRGAGLIDVETRFTRISGGAEQAAKNLEVMRKATKGTASDAELMQRGLVLLSSGLAKTSDDLEVIAKTVPALGRQFKGFAADRSFLSYTFMIANGIQSVKMRADDFGISVVAVERRMQELTRAGIDQRTALQQAVNEELLRVYDDLGLGVKTAADQMGALEAGMQNVGDQIDKEMMPLALRLGEGLNWLAESVVGPVASFIVKAFESVIISAEWVIASFGRLVEAGVQLFHAAAGLATGDTERVVAAGTRLNQILQETLDSATMGADRIEALWTGAGTGIQEFADRVDEGAAEIAAAASEIEEAAQKMADAWEDALEKDAERARQQFVQEWRRMEDAARNAARRMEDIYRNLARRREDMAREEADAIKRAQADTMAARVNAARDLADRLADIEREYQRRIREIQEQYQLSEAEAIAKRDALALVRARRQRDREMREATRTRNEQRSDAQRAYQRQLEELRTALAAQIAEAQEARKQQEEDLQRSLERQLEDERIAQAREREDAQIARNRAEADRLNYLGMIRSRLQLEFIQQRNEILNRYAILEIDYRNHLAQMAAMAAQTPAAMAGYPGVPTGWGPMGGAPIPMQYGGAGIVTRPTLFLAGERPEAFAFRPLGTSAVRPGAMGGVSVHQNFTFHGAFSENEKEWFSREAYQQAVNAVGAVLEVA